jgi:hypothetical protein
MPKRQVKVLGESQSQNIINGMAKKSSEVGRRSHFHYSVGVDKKALEKFSQTPNFTIY